MFPGALTAVDGSLLSVLPKLMQASFLKRSTGSGLVKWRLHTHFEVDRYVPTRIDVTPDGGGGAHDERAALEPHDRTGPHLRDGPRLREVQAVQPGSWRPAKLHAAAYAMQQAPRTKCWKNVRSPTPIAR